MEVSAEATAAGDTAINAVAGQHVGAVKPITVALREVLHDG